MDKVKLVALIVALYALEINARAELVKNTAKENGMKDGELFKLLKEAGYDPKAPVGTETPVITDENRQTPEAPKYSGPVQKVVLKHKTPYPKYRRAGLVLTQTPAEYEVTKTQLAALKKDGWVVVGE